MPQAIAAICGISAIVCWVIILVSAFKDALWKGIVGLICGCYLLYYAIFEFDHEYKWPIVVWWLVGGAVGGSIMRQYGYIGR